MKQYFSIPYYNEYGMLLRTKLGNFRTILNSFYPHSKVPAFEGKKRKHVMEIIFTLAMVGPSTTHEIAENALSINPKFKAFHKIPYENIRKLGGIYYKLINGRQEKKKGRQRKTKKYDGLISEGYLIQSGTKINNKGKKIPIYFLTLRGCFVALGFDIPNFDNFLENNSKNHLFFAYIKNIRALTSLSFVREIFLKPIINDIRKGRISYKDEEISYYFNQIAESISNNLGLKFTRKLQKFFDQTEHVKYKKFPGINEYEKLIDNTFYYERPKSDWLDSLIEKYYKDSNDEEFYRIYCDDKLEHHLVYRVMRNIHHTYFYVLGVKVIPRGPTKRLHRSKFWKQNRKYKKKFYPWKNPK